MTIENKKVKIEKPFNAEEYRIKFRARFAMMSFIFGMVFVTLACFNPVAAASKFTGTIIGFILGTMITLILTFYFGNSDSAPSVPDPLPLPAVPEIPKKPTLKMNLARSAGPAGGNQSGSVPGD